MGKPILPNPTNPIFAITSSKTFIAAQTKNGRISHLPFKH
jgi:hypothetical protein